uniref:Ovule protein n=1 Tax=Heterorhabditis bacteriophora TaxID=37862 RepID=A0A1I7WBH1_HETBA
MRHPSGIFIDQSWFPNMILLYHGLDNIVIYQRWPPRAWLIIKFEITCIKFFEPSPARSIRNCISIKNFH